MRIKRKNNAKGYWCENEYKYKNQIYFKNKIQIFFFGHFLKLFEYAIIIPIKAIENKLHQSSIILIDDCNLPGGGKGKKAINYLQSKGWQILISKYQVLLKK